MMMPTRSKNSGRKLVSHSDVRVETGLGGSSCAKFQIDFCNIRGLNSNINAVHQHLQHHKPHILALSETQVNASTNQTHLRLPKYELHTKFRFKRGVCVYTRADISCHREEALEPKNYDVIWLKLSSKTGTTFVCTIYLSPNDKTYRNFFSYLATTFDNLQQHYPNAEVIFLGDFNVHNSDWLRHSNKTDDAGREAEAFAISCNLSQLVDEPTRMPDIAGHHANTLDLFLTTTPDVYQTSVNAPLGNSDHMLISALRPFSPPPLAEPVTRKVWHYRSADWDGFRDFISSFPWNDVCFSTRNPSAAAEHITETLLAGMDTYIPFSIKKETPGKTWFDKRCDQAVQNKNRCYREWRNRPSPTTRENFVTARNACNQTIDQSKNAHDQKIRDKLLQCPNGSKSFWACAKSIGNNFATSTFPPLVDENNLTATTAKEKADMFAKMFAANSTLDDQGKEPPPVVDVASTMSEVVFRHQTVRNILRHLDTNKASGPDGIPAIVLKTCAPEITPVLCKLFNMSYKEGICPSIWKTARVQPIPKKGKKTVPSNYRPISLTSITSKVMEMAINTEILKYLENNKIISDKQYGFRRGRSTGDLLVYVTHLWNSTMEKFGEARVVALDISKAFDRVWHRSLLKKLLSCGLPTSLCRWISDFLNGRSLSVVVDGVSSDTHAINAGVPQGSVLSPTLFLIHINDLLSVTNNPIYSYADDSTLISSFSSSKPMTSASLKEHRRQQIRSINTDLEEILQWGRNNLVEFNAKKTQVCTFSRKFDRELESGLVMDGNTLSLATSLSLLGTSANTNFSWHDHVVALAKCAAQKLGFLSRARKYFTPQQLLTLYKAQVRPTMEYCSHIWSSAPKHTLALLDSIQRRAVRLIGDGLSLGGSLQSLDHRRKVGDLSLFYRYYHGQCSEQLAEAIPATARFGRSTRQASSAHRFAVHLETPRTLVYQNSFFWRVSKMWNSLPGDIFPEEYNLQKFKRAVNKYLSPSSTPPRSDT